MLTGMSTMLAQRGSTETQGKKGLGEVSSRLAKMLYRMMASTTSMGAELSTVCGVKPRLGVSSSILIMPGMTSEGERAERMEAKRPTSTVVHVPQEGELCSTRAPMPIITPNSAK